MSSVCVRVGVNQEWSHWELVTYLTGGLHLYIKNFLLQNKLGIYSATIHPESLPNEWLIHNHEN